MDENFSHLYLINGRTKLYKCISFLTLLLFSPQPPKFFIFLVSIFLDSIALLISVVWVNSLEDSFQIFLLFSLVSRCMWPYSINFFSVLYLIFWNSFFQFHDPSDFLVADMLKFWSSIVSLSVLHVFFLMLCCRFICAYAL